jgi:redox-sensing transcriptional repressor
MVGTGRPTAHERGRAESEERGALPRPLRERLARYHQIATRAGELGQATLSSASLAGMLGIDDTLVRKDLAAAGIAGRPKVGFATRDILCRLDDLLGLGDSNQAILIGCGHLGGAILNYAGFAKCGLKVVGVFDSDHAKVGRTVGGHEVLPMEKCRSVIEVFQVALAILTVPTSAAQELVDWLVGRGIRAIWNFAPVDLRLPPGVVVRNENLAVGLAQLIHSLKASRGGQTAAAEGGRNP